MDSDDDQQRRQQIPASSALPALSSKLVSLHSDIVSIFLLSLASPFIALASNVFFRRLLAGLLAAAYVCILLVLVMLVAVVLGVGLVRTWAEEPVSVRVSLPLDYTDPNPTAVFSLERIGGVPVGQTLHVSMDLVMPESDYNVDVGIFQLNIELTSIEGEIVAKSSQPCMLHFRSLPFRLMQTFVMGVPLLLGMATETQRIVLPILRHKEIDFPRTNQVRLTIIPRAGTWSVPQFYRTELVMTSRLPWMKDMLYKWRWTFYVWTTLNIFMVLVMVLIVFLRPLVLPVLASRLPKVEPPATELDPQEPMETERKGEGREVSESLRRWQQSRNKRKAALLHGAATDSWASSITFTPGEFEEESDDSESVCFGGYDE